MNRYLFVINPVAGGNDQTYLLEEIPRKCGNNKEYEFYQTTGKEDITQIEKLIERFQPEVCAIAGGDGTINMLIPTLLKYQLALAVIPAGSANGLATELNIEMDNALDVITHYQTSKLDIIRLNEHYMLHLADFGLNASLVKRYAFEKRRGFLGYAISAIKELMMRQEPFEVSILLDGKERIFSTEFLVIANAKTYGTGFIVNPIGKTNDGKVEICALREFSGQFLLDQWLTSDPADTHNEYFECFSVTNAVIRCAIPTDFQSDGEYLGQLTEVKVEVLPHQLTVLVGPIE